MAEPDEPPDQMAGGCGPGDEYNAPWALELQAQTPIRRSRP
ncbi:MAG: hypothetical protein ACLP22_10805 [Solirubrobacteraceae bacterium]